MLLVLYFVLPQIPILSTLQLIAQNTDILFVLLHARILLCRTSLGL